MSGNDVKIRILRASCAPVSYAFVRMAGHFDELGKAEEAERKQKEEADAEARQKAEEAKQGPLAREAMKRQREKGPSGGLPPASDDEQAKVVKNLLFKSTLQICFKVQLHGDGEMVYHEKIMGAGEVDAQSTKAIAKT